MAKSGLFITLLVYLSNSVLGCRRYPLYYDYAYYAGGLNGCSSGPCFNNGQCLPSNNGPLGFVCQCPFGYNGQRCEQKNSDPIILGVVLGIIFPILLITICASVAMYFYFFRQKKSSAVQPTGSFIMDPSIVMAAEKAESVPSYTTYVNDA